VVVCLERLADLHMAQLMALPLTVSCFSKIQIGFTFLVPTHPGSPGKRAVKWVCVCVVWGKATVVNAVIVVKVICKMASLSYMMVVWRVCHNYCLQCLDLSFVIMSQEWHPDL